MSQVKQKQAKLHAEDFIVFQDVSKIFPGAEALRNVTINIPKGQVVGLLGPNGSGKSTLLKLIAGLHRPTRGRVFINGRTPNRSTKAFVGYMPEVDHLYPWMSVERCIQFVSAFYEDWDEKRARRLLEFFELPLRQRVGKLSKGMRAKMRLSIVLARDASIILLDEPLSGIDPPSRVRIVDALLSEFQSGEQTIILSTHEVLETESLFEQLIFLSNGQVKLTGDVDALRQQYECSIQDLFEEVVTS